MSVITRETRRIFRRSAKKAIRTLLRSSKNSYINYTIASIALLIIMSLFTMLLAWLRGQYGFIT